MEFHQHPSGLVFPAESHEPQPAPTRIYGPLEIQSDEQRQAVYKALRELYEAMDLKQWAMKDTTALEAHRQAWRNLATMLLGDDIPDQEEYT